MLVPHRGGDDTSESDTVGLGVDEVRDRTLG